MAYGVQHGTGSASPVEVLSPQIARGLEDAIAKALMEKLPTLNSAIKDGIEGRAMIAKGRAMQENARRTLEDISKQAQVLTH